MARSHDHHHLQAFSQLQRNAKGAHEGAKKGSTVDKSQGGNNNQNQTGNKGLTPTKLDAIKRMNDIFIKIYKLAETIHTDQTGAFPITSQ